ncbi:MAG: hypothetical protein RLZZ451_123 [Pseudomonadota bacterium]
MAISTDMLAAFVKVSELASVSAAAGELGVGKSVVSKRVAQLEAAVKATLFSRSTRRIALTAAGETYLEFARRALREVASAEERLRDLRVELTGQIRLTAPVSWGQHVLAKRLPDFLRLHPAIEIELHLADRMMDVAAERIDLALRWTTLPAQDLTATPIAEVDWVIAAAPSYLAAAGGAPQAAAELARHPCLSYWRETSDDTWTLFEGGASHAVRVDSRYHVNNPDAGRCGAGRPRHRVAAGVRVPDGARRRPAAASASELRAADQVRHPHHRVLHPGAHAAGAHPGAARLPAHAARLTPPAARACYVATRVQVKKPLSVSRPRRGSSLSTPAGPLSLQWNTPPS